MADNLLDKASILLTPTAYDNGSMLSVKPTDGDGDFTFSRNSAATRVNAQGLVENVQILSGDLVQNGSFSQIGTEEVTNGNFSQEGSELVTNGDFSNGSTDWTLGTGWSIGTDKAISDGSSGSNNLRQSNILTIGSTYKITITVSDYVSGNVEASVGAVPRGTMSANGTYTFYQEATPTGNFYIIANNFIGSVTNVSVKEVGQDWSLGTGWSIGDSKVVGDGTSFSVISQTPISILNKKIKLTFDILDYVNGTFRLIPSDRQDGLDERFSGNGSYEVIYTSTVDVFRFQQQAFDGSITNISVKEVGQNWTFGDGFTPDQANSKATCDGTQSAVTNLTQTISTNIQNKLVRVSFTLDYTAGVLLGSLSGTGAVDFNNITSSGTYTAEMTSNEVNPPLILQGDTNFIGSITNIVIKEVTNDTNLPRINYEGFSYQDALGSEQIVNGDFSNGSANWILDANWSIGDDKAISDGATGFIRTSASVFESGKTYKVGLTVSNMTTGKVTYPYDGSGSTSILSNGTFSQIYTPDNTNKCWIYANNGFDGSIDNVSVKEYLGQEVVPDSGCGSWLLEDESTNLITQSELFSDSSWLKPDTIATNGVVSPSGDASAFNLLNDNATNQAYTNVNIAVTATNNYTFSAFIKKGNVRYVALANLNPFTLTYFDLENGIALGSTAISSSIKDYGNGWFRCSVETIADTTTKFCGIYLSENGTSLSATAIPNGDGIKIWGAQLEQQSYATSYIPTSGATSTRLRDLANGSGNSTLINSTEGVLYFEGAALANSVVIQRLSLSDGTNSNRVYLQNSTANNQIFVSVVSGGVSSVNVSTTSYDITQFNKIAIKFKANDFALWINGIEVATDTSAVMPIGLNELAYDDGNGGLQYFGKTKCLAVWKEALTDAELTLLTTI